MKVGEYADERILQLRNYYQRETQSYNILKDKIYIQGKWTGFRIVSLFQNQIKVLIPEDFTDMPETIAKVRYISHHHPAVILISDAYSENYGFHLLKRNAVDLNSSINQMKEAVLINAPETRVYDKGEIASDIGQGKWFEYKKLYIESGQSKVF